MASLNISQFLLEKKLNKVAALINFTHSHQYKLSNKLKISTEDKQQWRYIWEKYFTLALAELSYLFW